MTSKSEAPGSAFGMEHGSPIGAGAQRPPESELVGTSALDSLPAGSCPTRQRRQVGFRPTKVPSPESNTRRGSIAASYNRQRIYVPCGAFLARISQPEVDHAHLYCNKFAIRLAALKRNLFDLTTRWIARPGDRLFRHGPRPHPSSRAVVIASAIDFKDRSWAS